MRGHLRQRGDAWELRVYAGKDPVSGRRLYRTRTVRGGKRAAEDALARFVTEVAGILPTARDATVGELVAEWFELAKADLSPSTVRGYEVSIRCYITPALGDVRLERLRAAQLDQLYARMRAGQPPAVRPLATSTIRLVHAILRRALQQGVKWGWLTSNPALMATPPRVRHRPIDAPAPEVVGHLIERATAEDADLGAFLHLAATTGARRGELCGLSWKAVDLERGLLTIASSMVHAADGRLVAKGTKTHAVRRVALDLGTVVVLREHWARSCERAVICDASLGDGAYVFSRSPDSSTPWPPNDVTHAFIRLRDRLGHREVRLHDLRHFAATRLLGAGIPVRTVSGRLGHANAATTLGVYAHFLADSDRDAANALGDLVSRAKATCEGASKGADQSGVQRSSP
jgi:integrase